MAENSLALLSRATQMLAEVKMIDDAKYLMDIASTAKHYARKHKLGKDAVGHAKEIEIKAEILLGKFLAEMEKDKGGKPKSKPIYQEDRLKLTTYKEIGVSHNLAFESQQLASLSEEQKEKVITGKVPKKNAIRKIKETENRQRKVSCPIPAGLFNIIYADPPWQYEHEISDSRKIENQYPTMKLEQIAALKIPAAKNSILFLWSTNPKLKEALWIMEKWGFDYRTNLVWAKDKIGMGYYFRSQHELLLVGKKGNYPMPESANRPSSLVTFPRLKHSKKPEIIYSIIEGMYPEAKKIELFHRGEKRNGWESWGNE